MKFELFRRHLAHAGGLSRRQVLRLGAQTGAAGAVVAAGGGNWLTVPAAAAQTRNPTIPGTVPPLPPEATSPTAARRFRAAADVAFPDPAGPFDDDIFDVQAVLDGAWAPGPYGPLDQRGTFNEVTPAKTAEALSQLDAGEAVVTYNLGELLFNGFPAFPTTPVRLYDQVLVQSGYDPPPGFDGISQGSEPLGPNLVSGHEERFPNSGTYQIATQVDNLNHIGVGPVFYNGFRGPQIAADFGTLALGNEVMGPIVTRGVIVDVLGLKVAQGATGDYNRASGGEAVLRDDYRITIDDIEAALSRQGVAEIRAGDVVLLRTGWGAYVRTDPERYLSQEPGIYLAEARYLAARRPAMVGSDTWGLEVLAPDVTQGFAFPVHQELLTHYGIRIGEAMLTTQLAEDGVFEFVYIVTPQYALGATAGNTPPAGLAQPQTVTPAPTVDRYAGPNRAATAAVVSLRTFEEGAENAFVVRGDDFADALAAGAAAARLGTPILLTSGPELGIPTAVEYARLAPEEVFILGSTDAVPQAVEIALQQAAEVLPGGNAVTRIEGADRYATAAAVVRRFFDDDVDLVYVATGEAFADALAAGAAAAADDAPVLLVRPDGVPDPTRDLLQALEPSQVRVVGSEQAVSAAVADELGSLTGGTVTRIAGPDRYATAAALAEAAFDGADTVFVANGTRFPGALAAAPAAAAAGAPLLLLEPNAVPQATRAQLQRLQPRRIVVLGDTSAVPLALEAELAATLADG